MKARFARKYVTQIKDNRNGAMTLIFFSYNLYDQKRKID